MYHFLSILYYFGLVKLPAKNDYWDSKPWMPHHSLVHELGMTRDRFKFMWRHFHVSAPSLPSDLHTESDETDDDGSDLLETAVDRVELDQQQMLGEMNNNDDMNNNDADDETATAEEIKTWFDKIKPLVDHFRSVSFIMVAILGTLLSLDEMMIRFMGRSMETHRIKNKPIGEGFKLFILATFKGFIVNFTPDGRTAAKKGNQEYQLQPGVGKIESMILHICEIIDKLKRKQMDRINSLPRSTRSAGDSLFNESLNTSHCIAMDNYFTLPKVIKALRDKSIGVVGTARLNNHGHQRS